MKIILLLILFTFSTTSFSQVDRRIGSELYRNKSKSKEKTSIAETIENFFLKEIKMDGFQEAIIKNLAKEYEEKYNQIIGDNSLDELQKKGKFEDLNETFKAKVLEILNPEQQEIYLKKINKK